MSKKNFFREKITRRDFIKKAVITGAALSLSGVVINRLLRTRMRAPIDTYTNASASITESTALPLREAKYYESLPGEMVRCLLCPNKCVYGDEQRGNCGVRINKKGKLYTLGYGNPCAVHADPIEKKPVFHFHPTSLAFSIAVAGCCLRCHYCQNWQISQARPDETTNYDLPPQSVVTAAKKEGCKSIAYTYTEPTVFYEYMLDTSRLAREQGIKNVLVTCGYMNPEPLEELCEYLDAGNVNLKGFSNKFYEKLTLGKLDPMLEVIKILHEKKKWFEITYLAIPGWSDDMDQVSELVAWVKDNLGVDTPLHFLRFLPHYKMRNVPPTPTETLEKARNHALGEGLKYVYIGNVPGHEGENTYCPSCKKLLVDRTSFFIMENNIVDGKCKYCGEKIAGIWS